MSDYRLSDLLDMSIVQRLADANFRISGMPMTIVDPVDGAFLVKAGFSDICSRFHQMDPRTREQCRLSDRTILEHLDQEVYRYPCNNGLWQIAMPIMVAGRHLGTMFLTQFWSDQEAVDRTQFADQARRYGFDPEAYLAALDRMPRLSQDRLATIVCYDQALVHFIADLAEQSIRVIEARSELERRVQERTADLAEVNDLLRMEISERKHFEEKLRELSEIDYLTGIFNRRKLFDIMEVEIGKSHRYSRPLALILLDLDRFKRVNDRHGHHVGDAVLQDLVQVVKRCLRKVDVFARYGGEEFIVVCAETGQEGALVLAEKIRSAVEATVFPVAGQVTVSAGVAEYQDGNSDARLIERADAALYAAKRQGRNRVVAAGDGPGAGPGEVS
ncbi:MAG: diguanylate cyclase [Holophaga sp.]|nr:diguanylate cyclase [Holophaga sp.]